MDKDNIKLFRRRYIPNELIQLTGTGTLKDDEILYMDDELIITRWKSLHPRADFSGGISAFYLKKGWKVSKIFDNNGGLVHWYCDIVDYVFNEEGNSLIYEDLLFDVIVTASGKVKVLDSDEAAEAFETNLITKEQLTHALKAMHELLEVIYHARFDRIQALIDGYSIL